MNYVDAMEIVLLVVGMLIAGRTDGRVVNVKSGTVMIAVGLERTHAKNVDRMNRKRKRKKRKRKRKKRKRMRKKRKRQRKRIMNQKLLMKQIIKIEFKFIKFIYFINL
jgi:uncharacterized membrane protein